MGIGDFSLANFGKAVELIRGSSAGRSANKGSDPTTRSVHSTPLDVAADTFTGRTGITRNLHARTPGAQRGELTASSSQSISPLYSTNGSADPFSKAMMLSMRA